ncbi:hypothetical protein ABZ897_10800 [Nonomuraea sp. NPDC046802]
MMLPLGEWLRAYARAWAEHPPLMFYDPGIWYDRPDPDEDDEAEAVNW